MRWPARVQALNNHYLKNFDGRKGAEQKAGREPHIFPSKGIRDPAGKYFHFLLARAFTGLQEIRPGPNGPGICEQARTEPLR